jgi:hypothetical protein
MPLPNGYLSATRHPWVCFLFLLPLLLVYEGGVFWFGGGQANDLRNGADAWLRWGLEEVGFRQWLSAPIGVVGFLLIWAFRRWKDRPNATLSILVIMVIESFFFAVMLWLLSRNFGLVLDRVGIQLNISQPEVSRTITYIGAGIYEEVLFRLICFGGLVFFLRFALVPVLPAVLLAASASSVAFAMAHHIGPYGEPMDHYVFVFRVTAGLFFAFLYQLRGFGLAIGSHAGYNIIVGLRWEDTCHLATP